MSLVLSLFPGGGLLDHAFELEGFTVVRGPDVIWGGDIRTFHPPPGRFDGVIGGPPCQAFSPISNVNKARYGDDSVMPDLVPEFVRVVKEAMPVDWWLMENSRYCYDPDLEGCRSFEFDVSWFGEKQTRRRKFWSNLDLRPHLTTPALLPPDAGSEPTVCSAGSVDWKGSRAAAPARTLADCCELQGLPRDHFDHSPLKVAGAMKMVGNGVHVKMGRALARAIKQALAQDSAA